MHVAVDDPLDGVDEEDRDVRSLDRADRPEQRVLLDALLDPAAAPDAGRVDEHDPPAVPLDHGVDRVPRCSGQLGHDGAPGAHERVQEARFTDVRPADDRDARVVRRLGLVDRRQRGDDRVEEVARPGPLERRHRVHLTETELVELRGLRLAAPRVALVRDDERRLAAAPQLVGDVVLDRQDARLRVHDEEHEVGLGDREIGLLAHRGLHRSRARIVETAGVDERELAAAPVRGRVDPIARRAGEVLDDRDALTDEAVEQR